MAEKKVDALDMKEIELPETTFIRDIESRVIQSIVLRCIARVEGISLIVNTLIDNLLGRDTSERLKGIHVEQDQKNHSVFVKVEINVEYGISLPQKAEEIQTMLVEEISHLTGLHVSCVHVIFKNLMQELEPQEEEHQAALVSENDNDFCGDGC
ncbi:MAG: Asp23/Gls24 family envelope stress response protein [Parachlamydiales bacterium]|nr:Asp23/Gls24 family envelope stress response protein [Parachlamydiales bacterium]